MPITVIGKVGIPSSMQHDPQKYKVHRIAWGGKIPTREMTRKQHMTDHSEGSKGQWVNVTLEKRSISTISITGLGESPMVVAL